MVLIIEVEKNGKVIRIHETDLEKFAALGWAHIKAKVEPGPNADGNWSLRKDGQEVVVKPDQLEKFESLGWRVPGKFYPEDVSTAVPDEPKKAPEPVPAATPAPEPTPEPEPEATEKPAEEAQTDGEG